MSKAAKIAIALAVVALLVVVFYLGKCWETFDNGDKATLTYFFMPGCPYCVKFEPEWKKFVDIAKDLPVTVNADPMDGTDAKNAQLVSRYGIQGFPSVVLNKGDKALLYEGERTAEKLHAWVKANA